MSELFTHSPFADTSHDQAPKEQKGDGDSLIPPPPEHEMEVVIRTMASDIDHMAKSGGSVQPGQMFQGATSLRPERMSFGASAPVQDSSKFMLYVWIGLGLLGAAILFLVGYYVIPFLVPSSRPVAPTSVPERLSVSNTLPTSTVDTVNFSHESAFRVPLDERFSLSLGPAAGTEKEAYARELASLLKNAKPSSNLIEVEVKDSGNRSFAWTRFLSLLGADTAPEFWKGRFDEDFTMFFAKRGTEFDPAYVLRLKEGVAPLVLKQEILAFESEGDLFPSLYLANPGTPRGGFADAEIKNEPVRILRFGTSTRALVYGFPLGKYLMISTSEEGYRAAGFKL